MKITKNQRKWIDCVAVILIVAAFWLFDIPCFFKALFQIPCPGCGMTRAYIRLLQLDLKGAFAYHPMFWSVPVLAVLYFTDGRLFKRKWLGTVVFTAIMAGFFVHWLVQLFP